jgi:predicted XRE-type DNA-binding protein
VSYWIHPDALAEHGKQVAHYEGIQAGLGKRYHAEFREVLAVVVAAPERSRVVAGQDIRRAMFKVFHFDLVYRYGDGSPMSPLKDEFADDIDGIRVTPSSGNVFLDVGFDLAEAEVMALPAEVMIRIEQRVKSNGWTQVEAAKQRGITQPRVSKLLKGVWQDFSLDMLLTLAARAGLRPQLNLAG